MYEDEFTLNDTNKSDYQVYTVKNPVIWSDVPDPDVIRVNDIYYMVSTTMHMSPGVPIMIHFLLSVPELLPSVH